MIKLEREIERIYRKGNFENSSLTKAQSESGLDALYMLYKCSPGKTAANILANGILAVGMQGPKRKELTEKFVKLYKENVNPEHRDDNFGK